MSSSSVVIDSGSALTKAGFSGDDAPRQVFPTIVGRANSTFMMMDSSQKSTFVGDDAQARRGILRLRSPVEHGIVTDWDDMELIWHHTFYNELRIDPEKNNILLTETTMNPKANREKMAQIMFETFNVPGMYVARDAVMSLHSAGLQNGLVVESGCAATNVVPILDGFSVPPHAVMHSDLGGRDLTEYMQRLLFEGGLGWVMSGLDARAIVRDIKEKTACVALDFDEAIKNQNDPSTATRYELPDGTEITVDGGSRCQCPEALFRPHLVGGGPDEGLASMMMRSLYLCPVAQRRAVCSNIVLGGGNTMFPGLPERVALEMSEFGPPDFSSRVIAAPDRNVSAWIGGSIMSSLSSFGSKWVTKAEYDENGPSIVHNRCRL